MKQAQKRATFEDVNKAQDILLDFIDACIVANKPLDVEKRKLFIKNLRLATLGLGTDYEFIMIGRKGRYDLKHVEHAAYWLAYRQSNVVEFKEESIEIKNFWLLLRDKLFFIFPHAITMSIKISKEMTHLGPSEPGGV